MPTYISVSEIIEDGVIADQSAVVLRCKTPSGKLIAFWGELGNANRNIASIRHQVLPVVIELLDPECCIPTDWEKSKYGLVWSVPYDAEITINPEL